MGHCLFMRKGETHTVPISGILASDLAVGSSVYLMENGVATEYLVVNQGKPSGSSLYDDSCDGTWLLRKDIKEKRQWHSSDVNDYENSAIHIYLNSTFYNLFGSIEQSGIKQVKIPYVNGTGLSGSVDSGINGLSTKIFLLSGYEVGFTTSVNSYFPIDGVKLDYFVSGNGSDGQANRIAVLDGTSVDWYLRSATTSSDLFAYTVYKTGSWSNDVCTVLNGIRPALVLPSTAVFDTNTLILKGVA